MPSHFNGYIVYLFKKKSKYRPGDIRSVSRYEIGVERSLQTKTIMKGIDLDQCAELLDKYPNLYIDLSIGGDIRKFM